MKGDKKCPKCGEEIETLVAESQERRFYKIELEDDNLRWEEYGDPQTIKNEFFCPECNVNLFDNERDAKDFLKKGEE